MRRSSRTCGAPTPSLLLPVTERMASRWRYTLHMKEQPPIRSEQKPGTGIDRTLIRRLLAVSPSERVKLLVDEANNLADFDRKFRPR